MRHAPSLDFCNPWFKRNANGPHLFLKNIQQEELHTAHHTVPREYSSTVDGANHGLVRKKHDSP